MAADNIDGAEACSKQIATVRCPATGCMLNGHEITETAFKRQINRDLLNQRTAREQQLVWLWSQFTTRGIANSEGGVCS
jgi:hypothetical protein